MAIALFFSLTLLGCTRYPVIPLDKLGPIVFSANRSGDVTRGSNLYTMEPDGSNLLQVTHDDFGYGQPRWSPDGKTIVFQGPRTIANPDAVPLYLVDANGKNKRLLVSQGETAVWSPSGDLIAYSKDPRCGGVCANWDVFIFNLAKKTEISLTNDPGYYETVWDWSPDGQFLLIESNNPANNLGEDWEIYVLDTQGNYISRLTDNDVYDVSPRWSPDGSMVAYSAFDGKDWDIFVMNADGSNKRNLSDDDNVFSYSPCWSPDGLKILYSVSEGPKGYDLNVVNIYSINLDGTGLIKLTQGNFVNGGPDWRR
jgi:TolB protein